MESDFRSVCILLSFLSLFLLLLLKSEMAPQAWGYCSCDLRLPGNYTKRPSPFSHSLLMNVLLVTVFTMAMVATGGKGEVCGGRHNEQRTCAQGWCWDRSCPVQILLGYIYFMPFSIKLLSVGYMQFPSGFPCRWWPICMGNHLVSASSLHNMPSDHILFLTYCRYAKTDQLCYKHWATGYRGDSYTDTLIKKESLGSERMTAPFLMLNTFSFRSIYPSLKMSTCFGLQE